ncbi:hypothetical protein ACHAWF_010474 [Thalassiosira exigua]
MTAAPTPKEGTTVPTPTPTPPDPPSPPPPESPPDRSDEVAPPSANADEPPPVSSPGTSPASRVERSRENDDLARRRAFVAQQKLRLRVYREVTSFRTYPLQAMAVEDFDRLRASYFGGGGEGGRDDSSSSSSSSSDDDGDAAEGSGEVRAGNEARSAAEPSERAMRKRFAREFAEERSIPPAAVGAAVVVAGRRGSDERAEEGAADDGEEGRRSQARDSGPLEGDSTTDDPDDPRDRDSSRGPATTTIASTSASDRPTSAPPEPPRFLPPLWSTEPRLFAFEAAVGGKRRYVAAHLGRFLDRYWRECDARSRHHYELIKEGTPCRLYFDLEFNKRANPTLTPALTEDLLTELFDEVRRHFRLVYDISVERSGLVDLDSSTSAKFSRHWILHLPRGALFSDAREAGAFVRGLVARLDAERASGALRSRGSEVLADHLFVNAEGRSDGDDDEGPKKLARFIDLGVYTRNRIFRILGSAKFGKPADATLRIAEANEFPFPKGFDNGRFYLPATRAARGGASDADEDDADDDDFERFRQSLSWDDHAEAMAATLVVPANSSKINFPILEDPSNLLSEDERKQILTLKSGSGIDGGARKLGSRGTPSYGTSPFPKVERFVANTLGRRRDLVGAVGTWSVGAQLPLPREVSYNMKGNRWCENVGRAHKSNNIVWNVHLIDRICYQSCHDPECRGFRGETIDLPKEVYSEIDEYFVDYELSSLDVNGIAEDEENDPPSTPGDREFDDPELEAAMRELDISSVAKGKQTTADLDDQLAKLNLSDEETKSAEVKPLSEVNKQGANAPAADGAKSDFKCDERTAATEPWENDDHLDLELAKLNLLDIVSNHSDGTKSPCPTGTTEPSRCQRRPETES